MPLGPPPVDASQDLNRTVEELRRELAEALEQQTATSNILKAISTCPGDLGPVFEAILEKALTICDARFGHLLLYDGEAFHAAALRNVSPAYAELWQRGAVRFGLKTGLGRIVSTRQVV